MFISWAVTSYQSNGARCDFSQGISVCLIEIPYPDLPGSSYANDHCHTHPFPPPLHNSHASRSFLPRVLQLFRPALLLSPVHVHVRFVPSLCLVRRIRFDRRDSISPGSVFVIVLSISRTRKLFFSLRRFIRCTFVFRVHY